MFIFCSWSISFVKLVSIQTIIYEYTILKPLNVIQVRIGSHSAFPVQYSVFRCSDTLDSSISLHKYTNLLVSNLNLHQSTQFIFNLTDSYQLVLPSPLIGWNGECRQLIGSSAHCWIWASPQYRMTPPLHTHNTYNYCRSSSSHTGGNHIIPTICWLLNIAYRLVSYLRDAQR